MPGRPFNRASARVKTRTNRWQRNSKARNETRRARVIHTQTLNRLSSNKLASELVALLKSSEANPLSTCDDPATDVWAPEILEAYANRVAPYTTNPSELNRQARREVAAFKARYPSSGYRLIDLLLIILILAQTAQAQFFLPDLYAPFRSLNNYKPTFSAKPGELSQYDLLASRCANAAFLSGGLALALPLTAPFTGPLAMAASSCATASGLAGTSHRFVNHGSGHPNYTLSSKNAAFRVAAHVAGPIAKVTGIAEKAATVAQRLIKY